MVDVRCQPSVFELDSIVGQRFESAATIEAFIVLLFQYLLPELAWNRPSCAVTPTLNGRYFRPRYQHIAAQGFAVGVEERAFLASRANRTQDRHAAIERLCRLFHSAEPNFGSKRVTRMALPVVGIMAAIQACA